MIAYCLGGAQSVWDEYAAAKGLGGSVPHIVIACNFAGIEFSGHLDAWATLHPEWFDDWRQQRADLGYNTDYRAFVYKQKRNIPAEVVPYRWYGSSGLYMAQVALEQLGAAGAILCGVPMNNAGGHIRHGDVWNDANYYRQAFIRAHAAGANIRSMSGFTAEEFGLPTQEWIRSCA